MASESIEDDREKINIWASVPGVVFTEKDYDDFVKRWRSEREINQVTILEPCHGHSTNDWHTYPRMVELLTDKMVEFLSIPKEQIPALAIKYVDAVETERTERWCSCVWRIHPDDVKKPESKRRKVRIEENEACTLHTKVGFVLGFFGWLFGEVEPPKDGD